MYHRPRHVWATSKIQSFNPAHNVFTVTETDAAGNKGTATITVTYTDVTSTGRSRSTVPTNCSDLHNQYIEHHSQGLHL